jgi:hypothetical protein
MRLIKVVFVGWLLALVVVACSSSNDDSSGGAKPAACTAAPTPPAQDAFCLAVSVYDGRCGHCDDCTAKNLENCTKLGTTISAAYNAAYVACKDTAECSADPAYSACVEGKMKGATPSTAQLATKTDYCNRCNATNAADCTNFFESDPGKTGAGYTVLLYNDDIATKALTTCNTECDPFKYAVCVALLSCGPSGGDFCADGGLCAAH